MHDLIKKLNDTITKDTKKSQIEDILLNAIKEAFDATAEKDREKLRKELSRQFHPDKKSTEPFMLVLKNAGIEFQTVLNGHYHDESKQNNEHEEDPIGESYFPLNIIKQHENKLHSTIKKLKKLRNNAPEKIDETIKTSYPELYQYLNYPEMAQYAIYAAQTMLNGMLMAGGAYAYFLTLCYSILPNMVEFMLLSYATNHEYFYKQSGIALGKAIAAELEIECDAWSDEDVFTFFDTNTYQSASAKKHLLGKLSLDVESQPEALWLPQFKKCFLAQTLDALINAMDGLKSNASALKIMCILEEKKFNKNTCTNGQIILDLFKESDITENEINEVYDIIQQSISSGIQINRFSENILPVGVSEHLQEVYHGMQHSMQDEHTSLGTKILQCLALILASPLILIHAAANIINYLLPRLLYAVKMLAVAIVNAPLDIMDYFKSEPAEPEPKDQPTMMRCYPGHGLFSNSSNPSATNEDINLRANIPSCA